MAKAPLPSPELLRQLLEYDPETGFLYWKAREPHHFKNGRMPKTWNPANAGRRAGKRVLRKTGASWIEIRIYERPFRAHRVAWAVHYGSWPEDQIDHINGDPCDNRMINLRVVDDAENKRNLPLLKTNKTGVPGVLYHWDKGRDKHWIARISDRGKVLNLGRFYTKEEAIAVRRLAERELGYHPNHGRPSRR